MNLKVYDRIYFTIVYACLAFAAFITLYPFIYVFSMSVSTPEAAAAQMVYFFPVGFSTMAYERVFKNPEIWRFLYNAVWYTAVGTLCSVFFTALGAYPLSRRRFFARGFFNSIFIFTMFFGGGLIPFFIIVRTLGLYNSRWSMVIPFLIDTWLLIICRTFFQGLPEELFESAKIDGCSEIGIFRRIALPLSKQILAVLLLFYGIGNWNMWFFPVLFLGDRKLHPLQVYLKRVLVQNETSEAMLSWVTLGKGAYLSTLQVKYAIIIVASVPIIMLYPFVQKYFEKGFLIGALKG